MPGQEIAGLPLRELVEQVAVQPIAPGGGAVSGVTVALAAALVVKAARAGEWDEAAGAAAQAQLLRRRAEELPEESRRAFATAVELLRDRRGHDRELQDALARAAEVPLRTAGIAASVALLAAEVAERGRPDLRPEAVAACLLAEAACSAAAHLVEINLGMLRGDPRLERSAAAVREARAARERVMRNA